jgi:hypothetical protein
MRTFNSRTALAKQESVMCVVEGGVCPKCLTEHGPVAHQQDLLWLISSWRKHLTLFYRPNEGKGRRKQCAPTASSG